MKEMNSHRSPYDYKRRQHFFGPYKKQRTFPLGKTIGACVLFLLVAIVLKG